MNMPSSASTICAGGRWPSNADRRRNERRSKNCLYKFNDSDFDLFGCQSSPEPETKRRKLSPFHALSLGQQRYLAYEAYVSLLQRSSLTGQYEYGTSAHIPISQRNESSDGERMGEAQLFHTTTGTGTSTRGSYRLSLILQTFTEEEEDIIRKALYKEGPETDILATSGTDSVQRKSMHTLQPGTWLNDEVIHYFLLMLARRDAYLSEQDPSRKRCHFFKSFFVTKLLEDDGYKYSNVKRWSKKVPGKDVFQLDKIFCAVNVDKMHWTVAVIYVQEKRIVYYDSMSGGGERICKGLLRYLQDEHQAKKGQPLPDAEEWELVSYPDDVPQQRNGFDCGVFTCMFCDFLSIDCPLHFNRSHISHIRGRIALYIMRRAVE